MLLIEPAMKYEGDLLAYRGEFFRDGSSMDGCGSLRNFEKIDEWIAFVEAGKHPETVSEGLVPATQYLYVRETDGRVVGMLQLRHTLNEYTALYAGHIGYSIRPSERRRGYASTLLRDALPKCRELGLDRVLVCCKVENEASRRVILKNGGVYDATVTEPRRGVRLERYWIDLTKQKEIS